MIDSHLFRDPDDFCTFHFPGLHLLEVLKDRDINVRISGGVPVSITSLAKHGWSLTIRHNAYGGRSRFVFKSPDQRSTMLFRLNRAYRHLSLIESLDMLSEETGTATVIPRPIPALMSDEELLTMVHRNIKRRLNSKPKKRPTNTQNVERAAAFAAA